MTEDIEKKHLIEPLSDMFITELKDVLSNSIDSTRYKIHTRLLILYSSSIALFLLNFDSLGKLSGKGALLWCIIFIIPPFIYELLNSGKYLILINLKFIIKNTDELFKKCEDQIEDPEDHSKLAKLIILKIEKSELGVTSLEKLEKLLKFVFKGMDESKVGDTTLFLLKFLKERKFTKDKSIVGTFKYFKNDPLFKDESFELKIADVEGFYNNLKKSLVFFVVYIMGVFIFIFSIICTQFCHLVFWCG